MSDYQDNQTPPDEPIELTRPPAAGTRRATTRRNTTRSSASGGSDQAAGTVIAGRYLVLETLGEGATGIVYRCMDQMAANVEVAVKALNPDLAQDLDMIADVESNFRDLHELNHPAIAGYRTLEWDGPEGQETCYLVMDYIDGVDLAAHLRMKNGRLPVADAVQIVGELAEALDFGHAKGIIHRDLKPANIKIDAAQNARILDYGIASSLKRRSSDRNQEGGPTGTPHYMAPEQWRCEEPVGATDQYALAVIFYEMVAGAVPFTGNSIAEVQSLALSKKPVRPAGLTGAQWKALSKALDKDKFKRFPTCSEFAAALRVQSGGGGGGRRAPGLIWLVLAAVAVLGYVKRDEIRNWIWPPPPPPPPGTVAPCVHGRKPADCSICNPPTFRLPGYHQEFAGKQPTILFAPFISRIASGVLTGPEGLPTWNDERNGAIGQLSQAGAYSISPLSIKSGADLQTLADVIQQAAGRADFVVWGEQVAGEFCEISGSEEPDPDAPGEKRLRAGRYLKIMYTLIDLRSTNVVIRHPIETGGLYWKRGTFWLGHGQPITDLAAERMRVDLLNETFPIRVQAATTNGLDLILQSGHCTTGDVLEVFRAVSDGVGRSIGRAVVVNDASAPRAAFTNQIDPADLVKPANLYGKVVLAAAQNPCNGIVPPPPPPPPTCRHNFKDPQDCPKCHPENFCLIHNVRVPPKCPKCIEPPTIPPWPTNEHPTITVMDFGDISGASGGNRAQQLTSLVGAKLPARSDGMLTIVSQTQLVTMAKALQSKGQKFSGSVADYAQMNGWLSYILSGEIVNWHVAKRQRAAGVDTLTGTLKVAARMFRADANRKAVIWNGTIDKKVQLDAAAGLITEDSPEITDLLQQAADQIVQDLLADFPIRVLAVAEAGGTQVCTLDAGSARLRVGQELSIVTPMEVTSGNPALVPLTSVGRLVIQEVTDLHALGRVLSSEKPVSVGAQCRIPGNKTLNQEPVRKVPPGWSDR